MNWLALLAVQGTQECSPIQQFKSINSLVLGFLYSPTLTSIHEHWKNHSFDWTDLCWQSNVSAFEYAVQVGHSFSPKEQASFNFMAAVIICSDFGAPKNEVCHCFPIWSFDDSCYRVTPFSPHALKCLQLKIKEISAKNPKKGQLIQCFSDIKDPVFFCFSSLLPLLDQMSSPHGFKMLPQSQASPVQTKSRHRKLTISITCPFLKSRGNSPSHFVGHNFIICPISTCLSLTKWRHLDWLTSQDSMQ